MPSELWERVQVVMGGRNARGAKKGRRDFAFSGLISCHADERREHDEAKAA